MSKNIYHFFVEGEGERAIINTLKTDFQCIQAGKVDVFNVIQNKLNKNILMKLKPGERLLSWCLIQIKMKRIY